MRRAGIGLAEGVERAAQHALRGRREPRQLGRNRRVQPAAQAQRALRDVAREIADALEIGRDHLDRDHLAQIGRHRGLERQRLQHRLVDRDVEAVDLDVVVRDLRRERSVALEHRAHRLVEDRLGAAAHQQQRLAQLAQDGVEDAGHAWLHRISRTVP